MWPLSQVNSMNSKTLNIASQVTENGISLSLFQKEYSIEYPEEIWQQIPEIVQIFLKDNLVFAGTMHLAMSFKDYSSIQYQSNRPFFETHFFQNFLKDIPSCCDMDGTTIDAEILRFLKISYSFDPSTCIAPPLWNLNGDISELSKVPAIIPLSMGKDSLLSFAIAAEIGLEPIGVFVHEPSFTQERLHKERLIQDFEAEFQVKIQILEHNMGLLRDDKHLGVTENEYGWGLQSTEYALMMLPYAKYFNAQYIFFGNEQSTSASYMSQGWKVYPCYDQSHNWSVHINQMTQICSNPTPVQTGSLIEPILDMMIQRILVRRYPQHAKYQMSCFADGEAGKDYHWCHQCSICTKMYFLCVGGNVDPKAVGFRKSMLTLDELAYFPLLGGSSEYPYARTELARNEQLFALYCAHLLGSQEPLVQLFAKSELLSEAESRKTELIDLFLSIYPSITVPNDLKSKVIAIYEEELALFKKELNI